MFYVIHYVLSFDNKSADVPSPLYFGVGFTGHSQPVVGDFVPMPGFEHDMLVFHHSPGTAFTVQSVVRHPSETGIELKETPSPTIFMAEMKHLCAHLMTRQVDVHCRSYDEAIRCRNLVYEMLEDLVGRRKSSKSKEGVTYVLPPKPDPKPIRHQAPVLSAVS